MVGWHHRLNGYEFQQILGYSEGQGSLACCSSWDHKELDTMEQLSNKTVYMCQKFLYTFLRSHAKDTYEIQGYYHQYCIYNKTTISQILLSRVMIYI